MGVPGFFSGRSSGKLFHPVENSQCQGFSADRTDSVCCNSFMRLEADTAFAMPVQVVFTFLRIEFKGSQKGLRVARFQGGFYARKTQIRIKQVGLPAQLHG